MYVFDDTDPEDAAYLGLAKIPLLPLAHDKGISGIFELHRVRSIYISGCCLTIITRYKLIMHLHGKFINNMICTILVFEANLQDCPTFSSNMFINIIDQIIKRQLANLVCIVFVITKVNGSVNGDMTVELKWTHAYLPPRHATHTAAQLEAAPQETPERLALLPGEEMALQDSTVVAAAPATSYAPQPPRLRNPQAQSTPLPNRNRVR